MPWILDFRYWISDSLSVKLGFRIAIVREILDSLSCIPDSTSPGFRIPQEKFPVFRILQANISRIAESGFPCMRWNYSFSRPNEVLDRLDRAKFLIAKFGLISSTVKRSGLILCTFFSKKELYSQFLNISRSPGKLFSSHSNKYTTKFRAWQFLLCIIS